MTAELVPVENMAAIEALDPAAREVAVTHMLDEARGWLAHAVETTGPARIAEFKAFVATVAETTRQLQLSKEIQLDAQEMVRRAERGVGQAVRKGQAEGSVRTLDDTHTPGTNNRGYQGTSVHSSREFFNGTKERIAAYAVTDDVTDEQFDEAIEEAKDEGNLSRANVVRKVRGEAPKPTARPEMLRKTRHIDPHRVVSETVHALDGLAIGVRLVEDTDLAAQKPEDLSAWASALTDSLRSLNRLHRQIKELTQA